MSGEVKLMPCPFCKSRRIRTAEVAFGDEDTTRAVCLKCHAEGPNGSGRGGAIAAWNKRALTRPTVVTDEVVEREETLESISAWCDETFGPASPLRMAARANEEMAELIDKASRAETYSDEVLVEAADVLICLARFPGLWEAVERKMAINRGRAWRLTGEGTGYHISQTTAPE
jgi:hypothetical protein